MEHTQGKWINNALDIMSEDSKACICTCEGGRDGEAFSYEEDEANANFIVTACNSYNDLLAACKDGKLELNLLLNLAKLEPNKDFRESKVKAASGRIEQFEQAIAKAESD